jgi:ATP-dependent Clp protease ATP-binding subunit ClpC
MSERLHERFTKRARKVMQLADQEARRFNHAYVGTEHILLGLAKEGTGVAAHVLKNLDVDLQRIRVETDKIIQLSPHTVPFANLPQTPRVNKVVEYSMDEARDLNHNYVGTEHILLGLIREQECVATQVLMNLGLKLEDVRKEILNLIGDGVEYWASDGPGTLTLQHTSRARRFFRWLRSWIVASRPAK